MSRLPVTVEKLPPPLEMEALKALWSLGEGTVGQVRDQMQPNRPLAYTTVLTLLDRLERKGAVTRHKQGRGYVYEPALTRQAALEMALDRLLGDFFQNSHEELLAYLQGEPETPVPALEEVPQEESLDSALL
jgi:predicted transcriptional regulator